MKEIKIFNLSAKIIIGCGFSNKTFTESLESVKRATAVQNRIIGILVINNLAKLLIKAVMLSTNAITNPKTFIVVSFIVTSQKKKHHYDASDD